jgi:hypothetical protein
MDMKAGGPLYLNIQVALPNGSKKKTLVSLFFSMILYKMKQTDKAAFQFKFLLGFFEKNFTAFPFKYTRSHVYLTI